MSSNLIKLKKQGSPRDGLVNLLNSLREKERSLSNPLLKDWFDLRNQIRKVERMIKEST